MNNQITTIQNQKSVQTYDDMIVFDNMSIAGIIKQVHANNRQRSAQVQDVIVQLMTQVNDPQQLHMIIQLLSQYMGIGIKNDQIMVKVIGILQKYQIQKMKLSVQQDGVTDYSQLFKQLQQVRQEQQITNKQFKQTMDKMNLDQVFEQEGYI